MMNTMTGTRRHPRDGDSSETRIVQTAKAWAGKRAKSIISQFLLAVLFTLAISGQADGQTAQWSITIDGEMPGIGDKARFVIKAATGAMEGYDEQDRPHPPALPFDYVDFYSEHENDEPDWQGQPLGTTRYYQEVQPPLGPEHRSVLFYLESDQDSLVSLSWIRVNNALLDDYNVLIRDVSGNVSVDMKRQSFHDLSMAGGRRPFAIDFMYKGLSTPTVTPTPEMTATPSASPTPVLADGWWELFEMAAVWNENNYTGQSDRNGDMQVNETDVFDLMEAWHKVD